MTKKDYIRIIQISDTHVAANLQQTLLGVTMSKSFDAVLDLAYKQEAGKIDFMILSGDLSHDGSADSYHYVADAMKRFNVPVYAIPGNHDNPNVMYQVYPCGPIHENKLVVMNGWQFILLNSHLHGEVKGFLDQQELQFLKDCLDKNPKLRSVVVFHHQPTPVGCKWLDNIGLSNADEFWGMVKQHPNMHTVLFGHVHMEFSQVVHSIPCYSPPSTCIQFMRKQDYFGLENLPPGYRWINLYNDGRVETGVCRVGEYVGEFQVDAKGY